MLTPVEAQRVKASFDPDYYLTTYPEVKASGDDPFAHYMLRGWKEGRDPSPEFSTTTYLKHYSDIAEGGSNPFVHWVLHGIEEKRNPLSFQHRIRKAKYTPKVSVIIPNYNHASFLPRRIKSISRSDVSKF